MNQLPRHNHPLMKKESFLRVSDNAFMIAIEAKDKRFDPVRTTWSSGAGGADGEIRRLVGRGSEG